jgi:hypothetical protein
VFGPFKRDHGCLTFPSRHRTPALMEVTRHSRSSGSTPGSTTPSTTRTTDVTIARSSRSFVA